MMHKKRILVGVATLAGLSLVLAIEFGWRRFIYPRWLVHDVYRPRLAAVKVNDGINAWEAEQIAELYMLEYVSGCGAPLPPQLSDGRWNAALRLGVGGELSEIVVQIDARTGAVSSPGGPAFASFSEFANELLGWIPARRR